MIRKNMAGNFIVGLLVVAAFSCKKEPVVPRASQKTVTYLVTGTNFRLNYIDSNSVFKRDEVFSDTFRYEFKKGSGASIGISIFKASASDQVYSWNIYINGQLYANAFSEGGAYLTVPYD